MTRSLNRIKRVDRDMYSRRGLPALDAALAVPQSGFGQTAGDTATHPSQCRLVRDIIYGSGRVGVSPGSAGQLIDLRMDAYLPSAPAKPAPALIMAFGGGFTAGSKEDDVDHSEAAGNRNTGVADYCRRFAATGVAGFSVGYRLAGDGPAPFGEPVLGSSEIPLIAGVNEARAKAGLPPVTPRGMAQIVEAAIDDVASAGRAVESRATEFGVDPNHVVFGGWSAGGACALYSAYGKRVPCAGVIILSSYMPAAEMVRLLQPGAQRPPLLLFVGKQDLEPVRQEAPAMVEAMRRAGCDCQVVEVPNHGHTYPAEAMTDRGRSVELVFREQIRRWTGV